MSENRAQSLVGQRIGSFKILSLLGVGGMGKVYLAEDPRLERTVALKTLPTELASDPDRMRRFVQEARAASSLKHPNVATIYEIGESDGVHFIAQEYVEGQTPSFPLVAVGSLAANVATANQPCFWVEHRSGIVT